MRLTSQLQRKITYRLSPAVAAFRTRWGSTAEPTNIKNLHLLSLQLAKRGLALTGKWDRVFLNGTFSDLLGYTPPAAAKQKIPFITPELKELLNPGQMYSRFLYTEEGLSELLSGNDDDWNNRRWLIARVATVEGICRELSFKPEPDFFIPRKYD